MSALNQKKSLHRVHNSHGGRNKKINFNFLDDSFYASEKNEINHEKLVQLAEMAKEIPEPLLYGKFLNGEHFIKTLALVTNSVTETYRISIFLKKFLLPMLHQKHTLLDIGPGNGELTTLMGEVFKEITLADVSSIALEAVEKKLAHQSVKLKKIQGSILDTVLPHNHYDFVLLSHVLYYIDRKKWIYVTQKCYNSLKKGGVLLIVLSGAKLGKAALMNHFSNSAIDIDSYIQQCVKAIPCMLEVYFSEEKFFARDLNTMLHIAGFLLHDVNICTTKEKLTEYLINHHQREGNFFEISTQQEFIILTK